MATASNSRKYSFLVMAAKWHRDSKVEYDQHEDEECVDYDRQQKQKRQQRLRNKRRDKKRYEDEPLFDDRFEDQEDFNYIEEE